MVNVIGILTFGDCAGFKSPPLKRAHGGVIQDRVADALRHGPRSVTVPLPNRPCTTQTPLPVILTERAS